MVCHFRPLCLSCRCVSCRSTISHQQSTHLYPVPLNASHHLPIILLVTPDEERILEFLQTTTEFLSARDIGIGASPPEGCANPTWAQPYLIRLTKAGLLEMNPNGRFRLKQSHRTRLALRKAA